MVLLEVTTFMKFGTHFQKVNVDDFAAMTVEYIVPVSQCILCFGQSKAGVSQMSLMLSGNVRGS